MAKNIIFSQEQKELIALLPNGLPKMTDGAKLVLSNIIYLYGTDFAKENGYVFRSTDDMLKDTGISSKTTLSRAIRQLTLLGLMTVKSGSYESRTANEYRLSDEMLEKIGFNQSVLMGTHMGTHNQNEVIRQLIEENKSFRLSINELTEQIKVLTETVKTLEKNFMCTTETETEQSCNSSCNHISNLNNSSSNTIPERSCTGDVDEEVFQIENEEKGTGSEYHQPEKKPYNFNPKYFDSTQEPVKRKKSTGVVSSSLQIIEEENHPDTRTDADVVTIPSNESISNRTEQPDEAEKSSSKKGQSETDRFTLSQSSDCAFSTCSAAPRTLKEQYEEVLSDISRWVDLTVEEQISKEDENRKLLNEAYRRRGFEIAAEVHELMRPKAIELGELYPDYYDTYKNLNGFVSLGKFIKDTERRVLLHLRELHGQKAHANRYPDFENGSIILREAS